MEQKYQKIIIIEEEKYFNASNAESSGIIELDESEDIEQIEYTEEYEKKIEYY